MTEKIKNKEEYYLNALMDVSPNFIVISQGRKIINANKSLFDFVGFKNLEAFLQKYDCVCDLFVPFRDNALLKQMGEQTWIEYLLEHPNEKVAYMYKGEDLHIFKINVSKLEFEDTPFYAAVFSDITELKLQKQRYSDAIDGSRAGLWHWNLQDNTVFFSHSWKAMLGYEDDELKNEFATWKQRVHPDDLEQAMQTIQNNINKKTNFFQVIHRLRHKNGDWVWIDSRGKTFYDDQGNPVRMVGTHTDITMLKNSEEKNLLHAKRSDALLALPQLNDTLSEEEFMQKSMEFCEDLTHSVISFIHFVNDDEKTIELVTWSNRTLKNYCHAVFDRHYPADQAGIWAEALRQKKGLIFNDYASAPNKKGLPEGHAHLERFISLPVMEEGKVVMLCGVGNKTSDYNEMELESLQLIANQTWQLVQKKRNQAKLKEAQGLLMVKSRHAAMGEMLSMLAHQWRQPLSIINMSINNILLDLQLDAFKQEELETQLQDMMSQTQYLSNTIDDFRNFFKPSKQQEMEALHTTIENALILLNPSFTSNGIKATFENKTITKNKFYTKELLQVLISILTNAKEALIQTNIANPKITVHVSENKTTISIKITDNAGGIDQKILDKVFDPYFSTKQKKDGTGLGLYMSKVIVEKHLFGEIRVSNVSNGACFELLLPKS